MTRRGKLKIKIIKRDVLIIGGGAAGCYAAGKLAEESGLSVVIAEKANIVRSGCLAAGVNALNAYITPGHTPEDYAEYARKDAGGIVREDLLLTLSERLNQVTEDLEKMGLTILKDADGRYISRGWRNLKINGENIKPLLAGYAVSHKQVEVINHLNITDYLVEKKERETRIRGAVGFSTREEVFYVFYAKAVLIATGGASGLYRPNSPGASRHKMWYCPFNTGAGYAMGLLAGAEMTTFEMRFIALRCKDTLAPTGTIAQGVGAKQINGRGEVYEEKYGLSTSERVWGTTEEKKQGRGPCYLKTRGISGEQEKELYQAYLNMAPMQTLKWFAKGKGPSTENVEIEGSEPYVVGGHTASGYWVSTDRETTIRGLFAAGDVSGGAPQKYVTGAMAEAWIAAGSIKAYLDAGAFHEYPDIQEKEWIGTWKELKDQVTDPQAVKILETYEKFLSAQESVFSAEQLETAMQKVMDEYAGGIKSGYCYNEAGLGIAEQRIEELRELQKTLRAQSADELLQIYELRDRLITAKALIAHLGARKETRWHSFQENSDHPEKKEEYELYVNSKMEDGRIRIIYRPLVGKDVYYEHKD